jgi:RNA 2',3'-cyclic 3'-phosphodiesterase
MRMSNGQLRLFVAAYPPEDSARAMLQTLASLEPSIDPRHRVTPQDQVHVTLLFIGAVQARELPSIIESVQRSAAGIGPFSLRPLRLVTFPERGAVRLVAMETDTPPGLLELQRRLAQRLARKPRLRADDGFRPHLTLARFSGEARAGRIDATVDLSPFSIAEIILMHSKLLPAGARHEPVERVPLVA